MVKQKWLKNLSEEEQLALLKARHERDVIRAREYAQKNKVRNTARRYDISIEHLEEMIEKSNGKCAICQKDTGDRLNVDHCSESGRVRALLCTPCNTGLGLFRHDLKILQATVEYLKHHEQLCEEE